jgi:hypothetical protein
MQPYLWFVHVKFSIAILNILTVCSRNFKYVATPTSVIHVLAPFFVEESTYHAQLFPNCYEVWYTGYF